MLGQIQISLQDPITLIFIKAILSLNLVISKLGLNDTESSSLSWGLLKAKTKFKIYISHCKISMIIYIYYQHNILGHYLELHAAQACIMTDFCRVFANQYNSKPCYSPDGRLCWDSNRKRHESEQTGNNNTPKCPR